MKQLVTYFAALAAFVIADMAWLGTMGSRFYRPTLSKILLTSVNLPPALAFYALYPIGLVLFAVNPALKTNSLAAALIYGCLFGVVVKAVQPASGFFAQYSPILLALPTNRSLSMMGDALAS